MYRLHNKAHTHPKRSSETEIPSDQTHTALKEWAVTSAALGRGDQIIMMRKGGIREDGRHFKIEHNAFLLYPGLYHEGELLLKKGGVSKYKRKAQERHRENRKLKSKSGREIIYSASPGGENSSYRNAEFVSRKKTTKIFRIEKDGNSDGV